MSKTDLGLQLKEDYDLPVDVIVTPKKVIWVEEKLPKPEQGIIWEKIDEDMMEAIPILKEMKNIKDKC